MFNTFPKLIIYKYIYLIVNHVSMVKWYVKFGKVLNISNSKFTI